MHFAPPHGYHRIKLVSSFAELVGTPFDHGVNALCWPRTLPGNFGEVVEHLGVGEGIATARRRAPKSPGERGGAGGHRLLLEDQRLLREHGLAPVLECIHGYPRDEDAGPVPTDVFSFHADSATAEADTWLCTYHGPASEGLRNDEARRRVDIPETRAALLERFGGEDDAAFLEYLSENCYDLHYAPLPHARPFSFGRAISGASPWTIPAVPFPRAFIAHPKPSSQPPRLLLIS